MVATTVLLLGHGSRDPQANLEFEELVGVYRRLHPARTIAHAYVELARPSLGEALVALGAAAQPGDRVVVVPLFLFAAGHVKNDLPLALNEARCRFPRVEFFAARAFGPQAELAQLLAERIARVDHPAPDRTALIVIGRGSSDPDANSDFCKLVRLLGDGQRYREVVPAFIGITRPLFDEVLEQVARGRPERILVAPCFLFAGLLVERLSHQLTVFGERYPWIKTALAPHLGIDPVVLRLVDQRIEEAISGAAPLPCDNCHYRAPLPGRATEVGGLRALLWSLRHSFTHTQAMPHVHAHRPLRKHVLVCANADCAERGSIALLETLRRRLKALSRDDIRVTRTSCMGRCGEGPTVAVYPDGIWYRGVTEKDAEELVRDHLLGDRLVARLVDNIMQ